MDQWPNSTRKDMHRLALARIRAITWAVGMSFRTSEGELAEKRKQVSRDYLEALKRQAENVEYLPPAASS